jgi:hypothetical protein
MLHSPNHRWRSLTYYSRLLTSLDIEGASFWRSCHPLRHIIRRGARVRVCRWHSTRIRERRCFRPVNPRPHASTRRCGRLGEASLVQPLRYDDIVCTIEQVKFMSFFVVGDINPESIEWFGHIREIWPVCPFSLLFLVILSKRRASCEEVLCLGLNTNFSSRIRLR